MSGNSKPKYLKAQKKKNHNEWTNVLSKVTRKKFIAQKKERNKYITDTQIIEFMHEYIKGTKVSPWRHFLAKSAKETIMDLQEDQNGAVPAGSSGSL